jgi:uncharacterized protein (DUF2141 family)
MKNLKYILLITGLFALLSFQNNEETYSLTVKVSGLQNNDGVVQFSLYNKDGTIPDEHFKKYFKQLKGSITNNSSTVVFKNLPKGDYAVNILHDEDEDGKIDKGWILPVEGIGFSNISSFGPMNRPNFKKAKFELNKNKEIEVKVIYL